MTSVGRAIIASYARGYNLKLSLCIVSLVYISATKIQNLYCELKNLLSSVRLASLYIHMYNVNNNNMVDRREYSPVKKRSRN